MIPLKRVARPRFSGVLMAEPEDAQPEAKDEVKQDAPPEAIPAEDKKEVKDKTVHDQEPGAELLEIQVEPGADKRETSPTSMDVEAEAEAEDEEAEAEAEAEEDLSPLSKKRRLNE